MSIINKEILLADYLDNKISESELLSKHPELSEDIELIKRSKNALGKLELIDPKKEFDIRKTKSVFQINTKIWYAAASIILILGLGMLFNVINFKKIIL